MGKIIELPYRENPVEYLANIVKDRERTIVVFPGKRPALFLRKRLSELVGKAFIPPRIFSLEDFISYLYERGFGKAVFINSLDASWLIFTLSREMHRLKDYPTFESFFFWGTRIYNMFEEFEKELIPSEEFKKVKEYSELLGVPEGIRAILGTFSELKSRFDEELEKRGFTTPGKILRKVAESIENLRAELPGQVYFVGFSALTRAEEKILRTLLKGDVFLIRQGGDEWRFFKNMDEWGFAVERVKMEEPEPEIHLWASPNLHGEAVALSKILRNFAPEETVVVLPDPSILIPVLEEALTQYGSEFNISMGYPLKRTPLYALIESIMYLIETKRYEKFYSRSYLKLMLHPYMKNIMVEKDPSRMRIAVHYVEEQLTRMNRIFITLEEVEDIVAKLDPELKPHFHEVHDLFIRELERVETLRDLGDYLERISNFLVERSPMKFYPLSSSFLSHFFNFFSKFKTSLSADVRMSTQTLFQLLRHTILEERVPFEGSPLRGLQVLGLLETRSLNFKNVIMLDVNEGILPSVEPYDPLLPIPLRKALGLPTMREREEVIEYHMMRLLRGADKVHLIYVKSKDRERSRFVEKLLWERELKEKRLGAIEEKEVKFYAFSPEEKPKCIPKTDEIIEKIKNGITVTSLDRYLKCPFHFYFADILSLEEREEIEMEPEAAKVGSVIHEILQEYYKKFVGVKLSPEMLKIEELFEIIDRIFKKHFSSEEGEVYLLKRVVKHRLKTFVEMERKRAEKSNIIIRRLEYPMELTIKTSRGKLKIVGRADRIEEIDGELVISDYKTGSTDNLTPSLNNLQDDPTSLENIRKWMKSFQLPLYVIMATRDKKFRNFEISKLNARLLSLREPSSNKAIVSLFNNRMSPTDREYFIEQIFPLSLKTLVEEILNPDTPFYSDTSSDMCGFCPYSTLCGRVGIS